MCFCLPWLVYNSSKEAVWEYLVLKLNPSTSTFWLWISLQFCLALCSQVLDHGMSVLSVLNNQGNKKLAPTGGKGSGNWCIDSCKMLTYCSWTSLVVDPRVAWQLILCLGPPNLPLWQSSAASVPDGTFHLPVHLSVTENDVSHVVECSLFSCFSSSHPSQC